MGEYDGYTVPELKAMLDPEGNQDAWAQLSAWTEAIDSVNAHIKVLEDAKRDLIAAWPPDRNEASKAFITVLDKHLASMHTGVTRASANYTAVKQVLQALEGAKKELAEVYTRWQKQDKTDQDQWWITEHSPLDKTDDNWKTKLNREAAQILEKADQAVADSLATFAPIPISKPLDRFELLGPDDQGGPNPGMQLASGAMIAGSAGTAGYLQLPQIPPPTMPGGGSPILAGGGPATPAPTTVPPPANAPVGRVIGATPGFPNTLVGPTTSVGPTSRTPSAGAGRPGSPRAMPAGKVIGGPPATGPAGATTRTGSGARGGPTPRRVNPPGGVISGSRTTPGSQSTRSGPPTTGQRGTTPTTRTPTAGMTGRSRNRDEEVQRPGFDPDDPWRVEQGGPAVLEPRPEPTRHDPGPGVIGIDR